MGFLDRLHNVVNALGAAGTDAGGLFSDIVSAPWNNDVNGNALTVGYQTLVRRGGGLIGDLIGPKGVTGTIAGGIPEGYRAPVADVVNPTLDALNVAYRDLISHPTAAALTAASLADRPGGGGPVSLLDPSRWKAAWEISQHESPGQAFALALQTKDILNPQEVSAAKRTDNYQTISGVSDAILQMTNPINVALGPEGLGTLKQTQVGTHLGSISKVLATGAVGRNLARHPIVKQILIGDGGRADLERLVNSGRVEDLASRIETHGADGGIMTPAAIKGTFLAKHPYGAQMADVLNYAAQRGETVPAIRVMLGYKPELDALAQRSAELASKIDRLTAPRAEFGNVTAHADVVPSVVTDQLERLKAASKELTDAEWQASRLRAIQGQMQTFPSKLTLGTLERRAASEDWLQHGPYSTVTHIVHNMMPHTFINFDDAASDADLTRMLRHARVPTEMEQEWVSKYIGAANATDRAAIFERAQDATLDHLARTVGKLDAQDPDFQRLLDRQKLNRDRVSDIMRHTQFDGEGRGSLSIEDTNGNLQTTHLPLWITQQAQYAPVIDMRAVRKALRPMKDFKARYGTLGAGMDNLFAFQATHADLATAPEHILNTFDHIWRPAVLLTPGGVVRRMGDEAMRSTIRLGLLSQFQHLEEGAKNLWWKHFGGEAPGTHELSVLDGTFQGSMGAVGDATDLRKSLVSSSASNQTIFGAGEDGARGLLHPSGSWESVPPNDPLYRTKVRGVTPWERAVNRQIGQDPIFKRFLAGETPGQVETWLTKTQEGRYLAEQIGKTGDARRAMLDDAYSQMEAYLPTPELREAAAKGKATHKMLDAQVERDVQPVVHAEMLAEATGLGPVMKYVRHGTSKLWDAIESKPTDFAMRNPTFSDIYTREVARRALLAHGQGQAIDEALHVQIQNSARRYAMGQSKNLFDDYTERSQIARQLRFIVPFYGAYAQQVARYAGVISSDPSWVRKLQLIWQAPAKAGIVVDSAGNTLDEHGRIAQPVAGGGYKKGQQGAAGTHYITMTLPKALHDHIPGLRHGSRELKLGQSGLNLLTRGLPSFGPLVQMPVNVIAKENPSLAESLHAVLPYGPAQNTLSIIEPTTLRHVLDASHEHGQLFMNTRVRIYHDLLVTDNLKHKYESPTPADQKHLWDQAGSQARAFMWMHTLSQAYVPTSYTQGSPYQKYLDAYRSRLTYDAKLSDQQRQLPGYLSPQDWFLQTFGPEYFPLTESLSHSNNGVPPTMEAFNAQAKDPKLAKLIAANPDYGNLILGSDGAGAFNYSVYQYQFAHGIGDDSGRSQRASANPTEARIAPSVGLGWNEYSKIADTITTMLAVGGFSSITQKGAEDIHDVKQALIAGLAQKFPDWYEDYSKTDVLSNQKKIDALTQIAHSAPMMQVGPMARRDMAGLREYLDLRKQFTGLLAGQKNSTLAAKSNTDLRETWEAVVHALVERNPAFAALYNRWLSRDTIGATSAAVAAYESAVA